MTSNPRSGKLGTLNEDDHVKQNFKLRRAGTLSTLAYSEQS